jgi:predicted PurR-regulated permease PerM
VAGAVVDLVAVRSKEAPVKFDRLMEQLIGVFALLVLAAAALLVIAPFVTALLWGAILAYCSWQPYRSLARAFGGRHALAALLIVLSILVLLIVPMFYAGMAFSARAPDLVMLVQQRLAAGGPPLPEWLVQIPVVGPRVEEAWNAVASHNPEMVQRLRELAGPMLRGALGAAVAVLQGLGLLVLSVLFAAFFYLSGEGIGTALEAAMARIAGTRASYLLGLIGSTVKGVVYGILGTSLVQAVLCGFGYWIAGLPSPGLLGLATFFLAIIPGGPLLVLVPGAIWLVQRDAAGWAIFLVAWMVVVGVAVDNVLKPIIIGKSSHVPFILIMLGVIGGAAAFGLLGVFVGPTVLAVAHAVLRDWTTSTSVRRDAALAAPADPAPSLGAGTAAERRQAS